MTGWWKPGESWPIHRWWRWLEGGEPENWIVAIGVPYYAEIPEWLHSQLKSGDVMEYVINGRLKAGTWLLNGSKVGDGPVHRDLRVIEPIPKTLQERLAEFKARKRAPQR